MRLEGQPEEVKRSVFKDDRPTLSAMGKKGGKHSALNRALEKTKRKETLEEAALEQARLLSLSSDGDVLPPDPDIIASLEE
jgi:hypothetical protein